jgi:hypothetical protein
MVDKNERSAWPAITGIFLFLVIVGYLWVVADVVGNPGINHDEFLKAMITYTSLLAYVLMFFFIIKNEIRNFQIKKAHPDYKPSFSWWQRTGIFLVVLAVVGRSLSFLTFVIGNNGWNTITLFVALFTDSIIGKPRIVPPKPVDQTVLVQINDQSLVSANPIIDGSPPSNPLPQESIQKAPVKQSNSAAIIGLSIVVGFTILGIIIAGSPQNEITPSQYGNWTATPVPPTNTPIPNFTPHYVNSGSSAGCVRWSNVTLADVGKTMCVYGTVRRTWFSEQQWTQYFTFSSDPQAIYFQKFSYVFDPGLDGRCVQFTGEILQSYSTPYMDLLPEDVIYLCD